MLKILCRPRPLPFSPPPQRPADQRAIERASARLFSTDDGKTVLHHLQAQTFMRASGPDATESQLRHAEGQRAMIGQILRMIMAGRQP